MRLKVWVILASLISCAMAQTAAPKAAPRPAAKSAAPANDVDTVIQLVKSGMPDSLVVKTIQKSGKSYNLAPADVLRLRNGGVSNTVIEAMVDASATPAAAPAPSTAKAPPAATVAAAASPGDREPTEKEMLAIFQASAQATNAEFKSKEDQCKSGAYRNSNDSALAMMCLAGAVATGGRGGIRKNVTGFRKVACSRANGAPGWVCDYVMQTDVSGVNMPPSLKELTDTPTIQHGRFVYTGNQWILVQ